MRTIFRGGLIHIWCSSKYLRSGRTLCVGVERVNNKLLCVFIALKDQTTQWVCFFFPNIVTNILISVRTHKTPLKIDVEQYKNMKK